MDRGCPCISTAGDCVYLCDTHSQAFGGAETLRMASSASPEAAWYALGNAIESKHAFTVFIHSSKWSACMWSSVSAGGKLDPLIKDQGGARTEYVSDAPRASHKRPGAHHDNCLWYQIRLSQISGEPTCGHDLSLYARQWDMGPA